MLLVSKIIGIFIKKLINFCLQYGKLCFVCVTFSTIITVILLWIQIDLNTNNDVTANWYQEHQQQLQFQRPEMIVPTVTSKKVTKSLSEMIKTVPEMNEDIIFFNSIPKSGSEFIVLLLQWLEDFNGFKHVRLPGRNKTRLRRHEQEKLIQEAMTNVRDAAIPLTFDRRVFFINFTSFGHQSPTFINLVRDPIDKAIAKYYYYQVTPSPDYHTRQNNTMKETKKISTQSWESKVHYAVVRDFERCVKEDDPKCTYQNGSIYELTIPFFCGHDKSCMIHNNRWALNRAKETVERYYSVVGVLEEVNATLAVLQHRLPYFFRGVLDVFNMVLSDTTKRRDLNRPINVLDKEVKKKLESQLAMEYEFYHFIKRRLLSHYAIASEELDL